MGVLPISPLTTAVGTVGAVGIGSTVVMGVTDQETARKVRMGVNVIAGPLAGLVGIVGAVGVSSRPGYMETTGFRAWGAAEARLTGMSRAGQSLLLAGATFAGILTANLAASTVLGIDERSLVGS